METEALLRRSWELFGSERALFDPFVLAQGAYFLATGIWPYFTVAPSSA
jgi:hypothetical protein